MAFDEEQFPTDISRGATSRSRRIVDIVTLRSGFEQRNTIWSNSRRTYDVSLGFRDLEDIYDVLAFWEARRGRLRGFRFKDWADFTSAGPTETPTNTDQALASLTVTTFQMQKIYSPLSNPYTRNIDKPVSGTVVVADTLSGSMVENSDYLVDYTVGLIYFGLIPTDPTVGFEYDVPVRFANEELELNVALFDVGSIPAVNMVELRQLATSEITANQELALFNWLQAVDINTATNTNWDAIWGTL